MSGVDKNVADYRANGQNSGKKSFTQSCCLYTWLLNFLILALLIILIFFTPASIQKKIASKAQKILAKYSGEGFANDKGDNSDKKTQSEPQPKVIIKEKIVKVTENKQDEYLPAKFIPRKTIRTSKLFNGIQVKTELNTSQGLDAATELEDDSAYQIAIDINVKIPTPAVDLSDIEKANPDLAKILPALQQMLQNAKVSGFYHKLYENKKSRLQQKLTQLERMPWRHNLYDCQTILEMVHPQTSIPLLFIQAEMDVVSDGTDGDRMPLIDDYIANSSNFQPFTTYAWPKKTKQPNPLLASYVEKLKKAEERFKVKGLSVAENRKLREQIAYCKRAIPDLKARSFLIGEMDPFIVLPIFMLRYKKDYEFSPKAGDYAAVIHGKKIYPAIVGDAGPNHKMGEASLRIAKEISERAGVYNKPISKLEATYIVFPNSADAKRDAPDLQKMRMSVDDLLQKIGGYSESATLHEWEDLIAKKMAEHEAEKAENINNDESAKNVDDVNEEDKKPTKSAEIIDQMP